MHYDVCAVCVDAPVDHVSETTAHDERQPMVVVIVIVIIIFACMLIISAATYVFCRRGRRFVLVPKIATGFSDVKSSRKRVVVMHANVLYHADSGGGGGGDDGGKSCDMTMPFFPVVKIERGMSSRFASQSTTAASEYEIPLDADWEFPRHK